MSRLLINRNMLHGRRVKTVFIFSLSALLLSSTFALADFSQGYHTEEDISRGMLVSMSEEQFGHVVPANIENAENLLGVVIQKEDSLITFSTEEEGDDEEVIVSKSGEVSVLVSTLTGPIEAGDKIAPSNINGFGTKAVGSGNVIGEAQEDFNEETEGAREIDVDIEDVDSVSIGRITVLLDVHYYNHDPVPSLLSPLQDVAQAVAGDEVPLVRTLVSVGVVFLSLLIAAIILMSSVQGSLISLGRNPLAKKTIVSSMLMVFLLTMVVVTIGAVGGYLILIY